MLKKLWLDFISWLSEDSEIADSTRGYADGKHGRPCAHPRNAEYDEAWLRGASDRSKALGIQRALDPVFNKHDATRMTAKHFKPPCSGNACPVNERERSLL